MVGNDGGLDVSYDQAETWEFVNTRRPVGQFYKVSADMRKPYFVCGGLQDNGSWCGPSATRSQQRHPQLRLVPRRRRRRLLHRERPDRLAILYSESQDGATNRLDLGRGTDGQHPAARPGRSRRPAAAGRRRKASIRQVARAVRRSARRGQRQHRAAAAAGHELPLLLEHAVHAVAAQPVDDLSRRAIGCSSRWTAATPG